MGSRVVDPERDRVPMIEGLPVLDHVESAGAPTMGTSGKPVGAAAVVSTGGSMGLLRLPFDARSRRRLRPHARETAQRLDQKRKRLGGGHQKNLDVSRYFRPALKGVAGGMSC